MAWRFEWATDAERDLEALGAAQAKRILKKVIWLSQTDDPSRHVKLLRQPAIGDARLRVGDYRVALIIDVKLKSMTIAAVGHRSEIYN